MPIVSGIVTERQFCICMNFCLSKNETVTGWNIARMLAPDLKLSRADVDDWHQNLL